MSKVVFLTAPFPGVIRVGQEGQKLGLWDLLVLDPLTQQRLPLADCYILGAWHPQEYPDILDILVEQKKQVGVCWTSGPGEVGLEMEEMSFLRTILDDQRISFIWFGSKALAEIFPEKGFFAPYPLAIPLEMPPQTEKGLTMTLLCPSTAKKNIFNNLLAAQVLQRRRGLMLVTNVDPRILAFFSRGLNSYAPSMWIRQPEYEGFLRESQINLAVSWSETFSYQVAEACMAGAPSVVAKTTWWMPPEFKVEDPNNPLELAHRAETVIGLGERAFIAVQEYAIKANERLKVKLASLTE